MEFQVWGYKTRKIFAQRKLLKFENWCMKWIAVEIRHHFNNTPPLWRYLVKISTRKLWHTSSNSLERTDFKNVIFEKIPWAEVSEVKWPRNSKLLNKNLLKIDEIQNLAFATSKMASWPRRPRKGLSEFFRKIHFLTQEKALREISYSSAF